MEAIEICRAGYPTRKHFDEFLDRFSVLASSTLEKRFGSLSVHLDIENILTVWLCSY